MAYPHTHQLQGMWPMSPTPFRFWNCCSSLTSDVSWLWPSQVVQWEKVLVKWENNFNNYFLKTMAFILMLTCASLVIWWFCHLSYRCEWHPENMWLSGFFCNALLSTVYMRLGRKVSHWDTVSLLATQSHAQGSVAKRYHTYIHVHIHSYKQPCSKEHQLIPQR